MPLSKGLSQALKLQQVTFEAACEFKIVAEGGDAAAKKIAREDAIALSLLVRAWETCQERIRICRGKPLPGSRRPPPAEPPVKVLKFRNLPPVVAFPRKDTPTNGVQPQLPAPVTPQDG